MRIVPIYQALSLPVWHRWPAIMLYAGSNWIAQGYFSPQGMSTLLSLGVMAVMARWMLVLSAQDRRPRGRDALAAELRRSGPFILTLRA